MEISQDAFNSLTTLKESAVVFRFNTLPLKHIRESTNDLKMKHIRISKWLFIFANFCRKSLTYQTFFSKNILTFFVHDELWRS